MTHTPIPLAELEVFKQLKDIEIVFDVGARADVDYLILKPNIELHAFEPFPEFFKELAEAADKTTGTGKVYLNNFGLGDVEGIFEYHPHAQAFVGGEAPLDKGIFKYPIKTLDWYVKKSGVKKIDFLKIDVEGYDFKVLLGGKETIPKCKYIQYEHWNDKKEFEDILSKDFDMAYMGYRNVLCMNIKLVPEEERDRLVNFISDNEYHKLR